MEANQLERQTTADCTRDDNPSVAVIDEYFRCIFQSSKISMNPTTDDVIQKVEETVHPVT